MRSVIEIVSDEQQVMNEQVRAIADGYALAFMDESVTLEEAMPEMAAFDERAQTYDEAKQVMEEHRALLQNLTLNALSKSLGKPFLPGMNLPGRNCGNIIKNQELPLYKKPLPYKEVKVRPILNKYFPSN